MKLIEYGGCASFEVLAPTEKGTGPTKFEVSGVGTFGVGKNCVWFRLVTPVEQNGVMVLLDEHAFMLTREQVVSLTATLALCLSPTPRISEVPDPPAVSLLEGK